MGFPCSQYYEIESVLQRNFRKEWMSDEDWEMFKNLLKDDGISIERMSEEIEKGVENGVSVETQMILINNLLNKATT